MDVTLIDELNRLGFAPLRTRPEDFGVTVKELSEKMNCSEAVARSALDKAVKMGFLVKERFAIGAGGATMVYYKADAAK